MSDCRLHNGCLVYIFACLQRMQQVHENVHVMCMDVHVIVMYIKLGILTKAQAALSLTQAVSRQREFKSHMTIRTTANKKQSLLVHRQYNDNVPLTCTCMDANVYLQT